VDVAAQRVLRPGMSVVVSVNTKPGAAAEATRTASAQATDLVQRVPAFGEQAMSMTTIDTTGAASGSIRAPDCISGDVLRDVHGFLDIQIVSASLTRNSGRAGGVTRRNFLVQTSYLIAEWSPSRFPAFSPGAGTRIMFRPQRPASPLRA